MIQRYELENPSAEIINMNNNTKKLVQVWIHSNTLNLNRTDQMESASEPRHPWRKSEDADVGIHQPEPVNMKACGRVGFWACVFSI